MQYKYTALTQNDNAQAPLVRVDSSGEGSRHSGNTETTSGRKPMSLSRIAKARFLQRLIFQKNFEFYQKYI